MSVPLDRAYTGPADNKSSGVKNLWNDVSDDGQNTTDQLADNADSLYGGISDGSRTDETLSEAGYNAPDHLNKGAVDAARNTGYAQNMMTGPNIPITSPNADYNGMNWDKTQRLSRLADAFNSQTHWTPGNFNADGTGQVGQWQQNTPVQTEEMRRAELTRQGLGQQQSLELQRANDILAYPQKLVEMFDKGGFDANMAELEIRRNFAEFAQQARYNAQFSQVWQNALQKDIMSYTYKLKNWNGNEVVSRLYDLMASNPQAAQWIAGEIGNITAPSVQQYAANNIVSALMNTPAFKDMPPEKMYATIEQLLSNMTGFQSYTETARVTHSGVMGTGGGFAGLVQ